MHEYDLADPVRHSARRSTLRGEGGKFSDQRTQRVLAAVDWNDDRNDVASGRFGCVYNHRILPLYSRATWLGVFGADCMLRQTVVRLLEDERVRFIIVGGINTVLGYSLFAFFQILFGATIGYIGSLYASYAIAICIAYA